VGANDQVSRAVSLKKEKLRGSLGNSKTTGSGSGLRRKGKSYVFDPHLYHSWEGKELASRRGGGNSSPERLGTIKERSVHVVSAGEARTNTEGEEKSSVSLFEKGER